MYNENKEKYIVIDIDNYNLKTDCVDGGNKFSKIDIIVFASVLRQNNETYDCYSEVFILR